MGGQCDVGGAAARLDVGLTPRLRYGGHPFRPLLAGALLLIPFILTAGPAAADDEARKWVPAAYLKYHVTVMVCQATGLIIDLRSLMCAASLAPHMQGLNPWQTPGRSGAAGCS